MSQSMSVNKVTIELFGATLKWPSPSDSLFTLVFLSGLVFGTWAFELPLNAGHIYCATVGFAVPEFMERHPRIWSRLAAYPAASLTLMLVGMTPLAFIDL